MKVNKKEYTSIWDENGEIKIIDQRALPFEFNVISLSTFKDLVFAIKDMALRGAPLIGVAGAYGVYQILKEYTNELDFTIYFHNRINELINSRPTAINLAWAVNETINSIKGLETLEEKIKVALETARKIRQYEIDKSKNIGKFGLDLIKDIYNRTLKPVSILTHCNAGWLATVNYGTALSPIYAARDAGIPLQVYVDETGPRLQGAKLTAFELFHEKISHKIIPDNTGGLLMMNKMVDMVIVGSDRTALNGDVCNKIGTYLKALAAKDNNIPFYVALPGSTFDANIKTGLEIPIEERNQDEVLYKDVWFEGKLISGRIASPGSQALNYGFDITPARLITKLITDRGICDSNYQGISRLFPEFSV